MSRSSTFLLAPFIVLAGTAGCVNNDADAPMRILRNIAPGAGCSVDSSSNLFNDDGIVDAEPPIPTIPRHGYMFTPTVSNDLVLVDGESDVQKTIFVEGANVDITFYDTALFPAASFDAALLSFRTPVSGSISPGGGLSAFSFEIVPAQLLEAMVPIIAAEAAGNPNYRTTLDVRVQMFGTKGGGSVESNTFRYPVQVCAGCLSGIVGLCADLPTSFVPNTGGACNVLQDGFLDCCIGGAGETVCPAQPPDGA